MQYSFTCWHINYTQIAIAHTRNVTVKTEISVGVCLLVSTGNHNSIWRCSFPHDGSECIAVVVVCVHRLRYTVVGSGMISAWVIFYTIIFFICASAFIFSALPYHTSPSLYSYGQVIACPCTWRYWLWKHRCWSYNSHKNLNVVNSLNTKVLDYLKEGFIADAIIILLVIHYFWR